MSDTLTALPAPPSLGSPKPARRRVRLPEAAALLVFLVVEIVVFSVGSPYFLSVDNFLNILTAISVTGVLAAGATVLLIAGQFDLSVGSGVAFVGLTLALAAPALGLPAAVLLSIVVGLLIGAVNGFLVTVVGVNALITTLGTMAIFRGLTVSLGEGRNIPVTGFDWAIQRPLLGIPMPVIVLAVVVAVIAVLLHQTRYGRSVYAIGSNESAARLVGLRNRGILFTAFLISGGCIVIGGLMSTSLLGSTSGTSGLGLELAAVTAVILGGTSLKGGTGTVLGTVLGLVIVGVMSNGLTLMNVASSWQNVASGCLLILAVSFDRLRQRLGARA
ncbi:ABC transporter permease [Leucobacter allii]|uniref:ABC transporter permease n=1 Tax=Leucobacter allii TaxID=2932247 RepID=A0ABY4FIU5_9MICO|nr:ABC transporter permease [Leucobacter allii]UOQ55938.1 ABC transporter permease [Leucobacter allii]